MRRPPEMKNIFQEGAASKGGLLQTRHRPTPDPIHAARLYIVYSRSPWPCIVVVLISGLVKRQGCYKRLGLYGYNFTDKTISYSIINKQMHRTKTNYNDTE